MEVLQEKTDLKKVYPKYYRASKKPELLTLEPDHFLSLSGMSAPEDDLFLTGIKAMYAVAYRVKAYYKQLDQDFVVPKLECFWWVESTLPFDQTPRKEWFWELLIRMPGFVEKSIVDDCVSLAIKKTGISMLDEVYFKSIDEGECVQMMHIGSYEEEMPTIEKIQTFLDEKGLEICGRHHEIYISDPFKTPAERLKTILRYTVSPKSNNE